MPTRKQKARSKASGIGMDMLREEMLMCAYILIPRSVAVGGLRLNPGGRYSFSRPRGKRVKSFRLPGRARSV